MVRISDGILRAVVLLIVRFIIVRLVPVIVGVDGIVRIVNSCENMFQ